jgi:uncharacterized membrane protein YbhN (UPF0104 family)
MRLSLPAAHGLCLLIVAVDLLARSVRIRWYLRGLGADVSVGEALTATAWGDAAAGLTPLRFGGEAAKFAGLLRAGVRPSLAVVALALEAAVTYPLVAAFGLLLAWRFAPTWWAEAQPVISRTLGRGWPWLAGLAALTLALAWLGLRWRRAARRTPLEPASSWREAWRRVPAWAVLAGIPLSLFNILGRTAVLPLLALTLPAHPPFGVMLLGSFALLYSQLVLPMPAGAGAVDLGFLGGVAGNLGSGAGGLLLAWRSYTVGVGALLGLVLALRVLGWAAVRRLLAPTSPG